MNAFEIHVFGSVIKVWTCSFWLQHTSDTVYWFFWSLEVRYNEVLPYICDRYERRICVEHRRAVKGSGNVSGSAMLIMVRYDFLRHTVCLLESLKT